MSTLEAWVELLKERLAREEGSTLNCQIGFRVQTSSRAKPTERVTLQLKGTTATLIPGLRDDAIATVSLKPSFFETVVNDVEPVDFRYCKDLIRTDFHDRRHSRAVFLLGHICNVPKPFRVEVGVDAERRVEKSGVPDVIPRLRWSDDLINEYAERSHPVVLTGALEGWPALEWTREYLAEQMGSAMIGGFSCEQLFAPKAWALPAYTSGTPVTPAFEPYMGELPFLTGALREPYMFAGQAGGVSQVHRDFVNSFLVQLFGTKKFVFYPPRFSAEVYAMKSFSVSQHCWVQVFDPDLKIHPRFGELRPLEVDVVPGEVLLIPAGWWHAALATDATFSLGTFIHTGDKASAGGYE
jgi:hypothetical protein